MSRLEVVRDHDCAHCNHKSLAPPVGGGVGNPPPLSERLSCALEAHQAADAADAADVASCRQVTRRLGDPVADLLVGMIVEDEQRHDALPRAMTYRLHEEVEFVASSDAVPVRTGSGLGTVEAAASVRGLMIEGRTG